ncbi:MAG: hypothetical protein CMJ98_09135 [Planctomycetes bacterium]|jgi:hypothetical protein|nr:hypothetical protein [Planctomycetota bacterium]HJM57704.1 DUF4332 domain-containing protein [Planctomycetota bacterium]
MAANETQRGSNRLLCDALEAMPELDPSSCLQLASLSIHTTGELLVYCATGPGRTRVAKTAGLQAEQVEDCRIAAELMLVPDMDAHWVPLLRAAGVDSLRDLACRHPTTLTELLSRLYREPRIGKPLLDEADEPDEAGTGALGFFDVASWVAWAAAVLTSGDET